MAVCTLVAMYLSLVRLVSAEQYADIGETVAHWKADIEPASVLRQELLKASIDGKFEGNLWRSLLVRPDMRYSLPGVSDACWNSTLEVLTGLTSGEYYAIQMFDATPKFETGLLQGHFRWVGEFEACRNIKAYKEVPRSDNSTQHTYLFRGQYCSAVIMDLAKPTIPGVTVGLCLPDTCSSNDTVSLMAAVLLPLPSVWPVYGNCRPADKEPLDAAAIGVIIMLTVLGLLLLVATCYDIIVVQLGVTMRRGSATEPVVCTGISRDGATVTQGAEASGKYTEKRDDAAPLTSAGEPQGGLAMLMVRVSVYSNAIKLLSTEKRTGSLDCLHGIRFLSMTWVILGHTTQFGLANLRNPIGALDSIIKAFPTQAIISGTVSVDTFFVLSGALVSFLLLKELKKVGGPGKINWALYYFHRFWRLTPPYMLMLGSSTALFYYMGDGPFWAKDSLGQAECRKSWWANLLYINSVVPGHTACFGHAWYLANDMQFYILSPIFVIALFKNEIVGSILCLLTVLLSMISSGVITSINNYPSTTQEGYTGQKDGGAQFTDIYIAPWCRIGPYATGLLLGYLLYKTNCKAKLKWYQNAIGWAVATGVALAIVYGPYEITRTWTATSTAVSSLHAATHHNLWAMCVAWVVFACVTGNGGPVNTLLSWSALLPLSRLTYMAYLLHPAVVFWYYQTRQLPVFICVSELIYIFLGNLCISYGLAFVFSLWFEAPPMGLEKVMFMKKKKEEPNSQSA